MYELDFSACQERRERQDDQKAEEWGFATLELAELVRVWGKQAIETELAELPDTPPLQYQPLCAQCVNWRPPRLLELSNGSTYMSPGLCELRAASDLAQMPQHYAAKCSFYDPDTPF
ncbi:hypothetical protein IQ260_11040 [Leptolyngbya cf. ectocarpi LEGE 11479]|uniref:Uncharacterized protein n=1 Tax=Leptolyngbya cf. ectocarpi LEGE 11479 TaxID=1828722 RepID=A0A928X3Q7_LEPEC|nr:hypothetical protein [Leptolyngbya ectocarpi]MBE9067191.1 hypothetical protein [Leptolyngbya cf. ectocarpi LEGE 11479]